MLRLLRHPATPSPDVAVEAEAVWADGELHLAGRLSGDLAAVVIPPAGEPVRADELWRHTCFEAFVADEGGGYLEINVAPSRAWAAYAFDGYREGMRNADVEPSAIEVSFPLDGGRWRGAPDGGDGAANAFGDGASPAGDPASAGAQAERSPPSDPAPRGHLPPSRGKALVVSCALTLPTLPVRVALTAVLEHTDGTRSYWSLRHPEGKPDFHHPDSFVLELP